MNSQENRVTHMREKTEQQRRDEAELKANIDYAIEVARSLIEYKYEYARHPVRHENEFSTRPILTTVKIPPHLAVVTYFPSQYQEPLTVVTSMNVVATIAVPDAMGMTAREREWLMLLQKRVRLPSFDYSSAAQALWTEIDYGIPAASPLGKRLIAKAEKMLADGEKMTECIQPD